jgi:hypothetical protein
VDSDPCRIANCANARTSTNTQTFRDLRRDINNLAGNDVQTGFYTPTITPIQGLSGPTINVTQPYAYKCIEDMCKVTGRFTSNGIIGDSNIFFETSLPVASAFTGTDQANGNDVINLIGATGTGVPSSLMTFSRPATGNVETQIPLSAAIVGIPTVAVQQTIMYQLL